MQDRAFNDDGSINFSNGLGQTRCRRAAGARRSARRRSPPGVNPHVHPTWVPEYFGDHALVNGVLWPKKTVETGWYRIRVVERLRLPLLHHRPQHPADGQPAPAPGTAAASNTAFYVIANDQGYLQSPVRTTTLHDVPG